MTLFTLSAAVSMLFITSSTPLMMALLIILQTTLVAVSMYISLVTSWLSFILFMVLVSAMMVIFVYVSSLASNDFMVTPSYMFTATLYSTPLLGLAAYFTLSPRVPPSTSQLTLTDADLAPTTLWKLYTSYTSTLTLFLILYLLVALIVVAKISLSTKGALRALGS
uniref:NADH dehydrogenase subunit 6 n=1 Tax=Acanthogammarus victorii TaxID=65437 RepID=A0A1L5BW77_9CRUS|nr:NADH dehydrogenase subunit 6 [Acanthogammarus victorii]